MKYIILISSFLNFAPLSAQNLKISLIPSIGLGDGLYTFPDNTTGYYPIKKTKFNPFAPIDVLFNLSGQATFYNKYSIELGIGNGYTAIGYRAFMGIDQQIDTLPNGDIIIRTVTDYHSFKRGNPTIKIPIVFTYHLNKRSGDTSYNEQISIENSDAKKKLKLKLSLSGGVNIIKQNFTSHYFDEDDYKENITKTDTVVLYSTHKYLNKIGLSTILGVNVNFVKKTKTLFSIQLLYDKGLTTLLKQNIFIYRNNMLTYSESIISKGSMIYVRLAVPLRVYKSKSIEEY